MTRDHFIPGYARAILAALRFSSPGHEGIAALTDAEWKQALEFCDRTQLTLPLAVNCAEKLPDWVRARMDGNLAANAERWRRLEQTYRRISIALRAGGIEFLVLKGFSQYPDFVGDPRYRAQYDIDIYVPRERVFDARDIALELGYEPLGDRDRFPTDHLPTMIRKTGWEWRGDFFDVDIPVSIEPHFQFWDEKTERFAPAGLEEFWERRRNRKIEDLEFTALHPADAVAYSALHLLRHLLRGDLRPSHVYELAWLLDHKADDTEFWETWRRSHPDTMRRLEAICFGLAQRWFQCRMPLEAAQEIAALPAEICRWLALHGESPLIGLFRPNKAELWLHWNLVDSALDRAAVLRRRLVPQLPGPVDAVHLPERQITWRIRLRSWWRYLEYAAGRAWHHAQALGPTVWSAVEWFTTAGGFNGQFWRFLASASFFNFGLFIYFLLYNLYLLRLGFHEDFLGYVSSASTAGSVLGSIPAAIALQRFGIRPTLLVVFSAIACLSGLRAVVVSPPALLALAFASGAVLVSYAVALSPTVAHLTTERNRTRGFSLVFSLGISIGIVGGMAGGHLPGWLAEFHLAAPGTMAYRGALLTGSAFVLLALWPAWRLQLGEPVSEERKLHRPSPFVLRFLLAMAVWNLGTGSFNPFFNAFFVAGRLPVEQIGILFSSAQLAQVCAILAAPMLFRRFGLTRGVGGMQCATALALLALSAAGSTVWAGAGYLAYMVSQYMSEPGMFTMLMDGVPANGRSSASAMNFLVVSGAQAVAAAIAGRMLRHFGYPPVLIAAAVICAVAAALYLVLLGGKRPSSE